MSSQPTLDGIHPVETGRVSRLVAQQLEELLRSGQVAVGDRLPPERALAEMFGVGRNSVREALRELETRGLLERRRGHGTRVRDADVRDILAPLRAVITLSGTAVDQVIEFRRTFEPAVSALAARNLTDSSAEGLTEAFRAYRQAINDRSGASAVPVRADANFHRAIAVATGNPIVIALHEALDEMLVDFRARLVDTSYQASRRVARGHREILDAIIAGDADAAWAATSAHLTAVDASIARHR
jgi:GntR family transcriptional regulator, transcriptional repressor for pyruvate dehydrogenase complex